MESYHGGRWYAWNNFYHTYTKSKLYPNKSPVSLHKIVKKEKGYRMNKDQTTNWLIDTGLVAVFLAGFFPEQTGLELHQWIGLAAYALAAWHLVTHWKWVSSVTVRYFGKTSGRARLCYLFDAVIFIGFLVVGVTGLATSTWFNLALSSFDVWMDVHVWAAILTLVLTGIKLAMHWRWIVATTRKIFSGSRKPRRTETPVLRPIPAAVPVRAGQQMSRRDFIKVMGTVGVASFIAIRSAAGGLSSVAETASGDTGSASTSSSSTGSANTEGFSQPQNLSGSSSGSSSQTCSVLCSHNCSYPGRCGRYTDTNNNGKCDNGECV
jgi:hypothetical protein